MLRIPMRDCVQQLDNILSYTGKKLLNDPGTISHFFTMRRH